MQKFRKKCPFSILPQKCGQSGNDGNQKKDFKHHICAYNYNTRMGFRDHKKILGSRVLSSALMWEGGVSDSHVQAQILPVGALKGDEHVGRTCRK